MNIMVMNLVGFSSSLQRSGKVLFFGILYDRLNYSVVLCAKNIFNQFIYVVLYSSGEVWFLIVTIFLGSGCSRDSDAQTSRDHCERGNSYRLVGLRSGRILEK
jgi:hypothetical protein